MKRFQGIVIGVMLCLCVAAVAPAKKYWQDQIVKPDQAWVEAYGSEMTEAAPLIMALQNTLKKIADNDMKLAFNTKALVVLANRYGVGIRQLSEQVVELDKRLTALEPADPNEVEE